MHRTFLFLQLVQAADTFFPDAILLAFLMACKNDFRSLSAPIGLNWSISERSRARPEAIGFRELSGQKGKYVMTEQNFEWFFVMCHRVNSASGRGDSDSSRKK